MKTSIRSWFTGRMITVLTVGLIAGWLADRVFLGLFLAVLFYLAWSHYQLSRLLNWLNEASHKELDPPESSGIWGDIFDGIYRIQRKHSRSKQRLTNVIERIQESTAALNDGIIMADKNGGLEWWNRAAGEHLGLQMPDDQGQPLTNLVRNPKFAAYMENSRGKEPIKIDSPAHTNRQLQIAITVYGQGNRLLLVRDVTRLHQLEIMRTDFVANVSHELRTPLTVISGYLETMMDSADQNTNIPPVFNRALGQMQEQATRMQRLIEDLLLLSRLEATEPERLNRSVSLKPLLKGIVDDARALSGDNQHQVKLKCEDDAFLSGDTMELRSAFSNLIYNAIRYTPAGGKVTVKWHQNEEGGHLIVEDNGIGIDPLYIPRLTERFYRVDKSRSNVTGGTGLGLAIVKHVLLRHDGRITISSHPGKGSRFTCHFPLARVIQPEVTTE
ncbi:phosphate regulon sensor histidine kinase PhoR [Endozoicomonas ascidiicola]|uniref:phosphate regulon sensor histidine kinase PhoR n=1 Tax=Endozoicomonas ascidiicola TaxID=1698521 RepID=UPI000A3F8FB6|nr:phosphate regulon sensor histidine kinase PhoR [Endozoicomonas ascidiicola]